MGSIGSRRFIYSLEIIKIFCVTKAEKEAGSVRTAFACAGLFFPQLCATTQSRNIQSTGQETHWVPPARKLGDGGILACALRVLSTTKCV